VSRVEAKREAQRAKGNEENSRKAAKDEAKPDCSEQLATGSSSVYGLQDTKQ